MVKGMSGSLGIELSVAQSDLIQALSVLLLGKKLHSRSFSAKNYTKILGRVVQSAKTLLLTDWDQGENYKHILNDISVHFFETS